MGQSLVGAFCVHCILCLWQRQGRSQGDASWFRRTCQPKTRTKPRCQNHAARRTGRDPLFCRANTLDLSNSPPYTADACTRGRTNKKIRAVRTTGAPKNSARGPRQQRGTNDMEILPPLLGLVGLVCAFVLYGMVMKYPEGEDAIKKIGDQIHEGAMVFMRREYTILVMFLAAQVVLTYLFLDASVTIAVIVGAVASASRRLDRHVLRPPRPTCGPPPRRHLKRARRKRADGGVLRRLNHGPVRRLAMGLIGLGAASCTWFIGGDADSAHVMHGFGMGASSWRCSPASAAVSSPRAPTSAPTWWVRSKRVFPRMTPQPRGDRRQCGRQRGRRCGMGSDIFEILLRLHDRRPSRSRAAPCAVENRASNDVPAAGLAPLGLSLHRAGSIWSAPQQRMPPKRRCALARCGAPLILHGAWSLS